MTSKPVILRELTNRDVAEAVACYLIDDGDQAAPMFIAALEQAYIHVGRHPATGSLCYAHELNLPGPIFWQLTRFPYVVLHRAYQPHRRVARAAWLS